jgi:dUTP pyrophosphatase
MTQAIILKAKKLDPAAQIPTKHHNSDLGWDLYALEGWIINPRDMKLIRTGIAIQFPPYIGGIIKDRSGMASKKGVFVHAGVIDPDYRGEIMVLLFNGTLSAVEIKQGDRIAQMILIPSFQVEGNTIIETETLDFTERGEKGFGSSDV